MHWPSAEVLDALQDTELLSLWLCRRIESLVSDVQSLEEWQNEQFEHTAREQFLELGSALDRVCLSVLQSDDTHLAQEWYFKLQEGDASFPQLAQQSLGRSRETSGHLGPIRVEELSSPIDRLVLRSQPGVVQPPVRIANGRRIIIRLDSRQPAQWDEPTRRELISRLHRNWLSRCIEPLIAKHPATGSSCMISLP